MNIQELKEKHPERYEREYWDWVRYATDYDWYESTLDYMKEEGKTRGFYIDDINFRGFWSQGDGASWEGVVYLRDYAVANGLEAEPAWYLLIELAADGWIDDAARVYCSGRDNLLMRVGDFQTHYDRDSEVQKGALAGANVQELVDALGGDSIVDDALLEIKESAEDFAGDIYRALRDEYEHLTSEESFDEHCECNEVTFDEGEYK